MATAVLPADHAPSECAALSRPHPFAASNAVTNLVLGGVTSARKARKGHPSRPHESAPRRCSTLFPTPVPPFEPEGRGFGSLPACRRSLIVRLRPLLGVLMAPCVSDRRTVASARSSGSRRSPKCRGRTC